MSNKVIESRYTIEYIYPDSFSDSQKAPTSSIGWKLLSVLGIVGVLTLGVFASVFYPFNTEKEPDQTIVATEDEIEDEITDISTDEEFEEETAPIEATIDENNEALIKIEELSQQNNEQKEASSKQLVMNEELTQKVDEISQLLLQEKKKNEELATKISSKENKNNKLSKLLEDALNKVNSADKRYIASLVKLETKKILPEKKKETTASKEIISSEIAKQEPAIPKKINDNNSVRLSNNTTSQIDAIVLAMQGINKNPIRPVTKTNPPPSQIIHATKLTTKSKEEEKAELLHVSLQNQINNLITSNDIPATSYKAALKEESSVRNNAVRSITVQKGDTLWDIARRAYGNGSFYKKIIDANPQITKNGKIFLKEGQIIRVPI